MYRVMITNRERTGSKLIDFHIKDERGRTVGMSIKTYTIHTKAIDDNARSWYNSKVKPGIVYVAYVNITRNGENYGAVHGEIWSSSAKEREQVVNLKVSEARKRMTRKYK